MTCLQFNMNILVVFLQQFFHLEGLVVGYHHCMLDKCDMAQINNCFSMKTRMTSALVLTSSLRSVSTGWFPTAEGKKQQQPQHKFLFCRIWAWFIQWSSNKSHPITGTAGRKLKARKDVCQEHCIYLLSYISTTVFFQALWRKANPNFWPFTLSSLIKIFHAQPFSSNYSSWKNHTTKLWKKKKHHPIMENIHPLLYFNPHKS